MRIVSLLPGATESLWALGLGGSLAGVTHECDHPPEVQGLPRVTRPRLELDGLDGGQIEHAVSEAAARGEELYGIDAAAIRSLRPDLVVAQDVCAVCAVPADLVERELAGLRVLRQHAHTLEDVLSGIDELAAVAGGDGGLTGRLRARIDAAATRVGGRRVRGVFLEWLDPPYAAGHWTPDILRLAGLDDPLARSGVPSVPSSWQAVAAARPEVLVMAPCGFPLQRARREAERVAAAVAESAPRRVAVFDGSAYFNRPGPRLVDSLELLVDALWGADGAA